MYREPDKPTKLAVALESIGHNLNGLWTSMMWLSDDIASLRAAILSTEKPDEEDYEESWRYEEAPLVLELLEMILGTEHEVNYSAARQLKNLLGGDSSSDTVRRIMREELAKIDGDVALDLLDEYLDKQELNQQEKEKESGE